MLFCILKSSLYQVGLTFVVGDAIVKALCSIWSCGSVEGLNRERAGWWGLCPVLKQCLFYKSKLNDVVLQFITFRGSQISPHKAWLTVIVAKILISTAVSGQWPGLSFITLTELHYTVLIQLYPGPLWVDHLIHKQHSLSTLTLTHTEHLSHRAHSHTLSSLNYWKNSHNHFPYQPQSIHVITARTKPWHKL